MGGGSSASLYAASADLSAGDKETISQRLRGEYDSYLTAKGGAGDDVELFNVLKETYDKSLQDLSSRTDATSPHIKQQQELTINTQFSPSPPSPSYIGKSVPGIDIVGSPPLSMTPKTPKRLSCSLKSPDVVETVIDYVDDESPVAIVRGRTSTELVDEMSDMMKSSERIASFISQIKDGEIPTNNASEFRARRLTYAQKVNDKSGVGSPLPSNSRKRTTIYASSELGVSQKKKPPFPRSTWELTLAMG